MASTFLKRAFALGAVSTVAILAGCSGSGAGGADVTTLRMATPVAEASVQGQSIQAWADDVVEASGGTLEIEIYPAGSLLAGTDVAPGVADGRADLGMSFSNYHAAELPYWGVVAYPFVTSSWDVYNEAFDQLQEEFPEVNAAFEEFGIRSIASVTNGAATSATRQPVGSVSDLSGKRMRGSGLMADTLERAGADPVFMELAELYESLQRGALDGFMGVDMGVATGFKAEEVTPYFRDYGIGMYAGAEIFINEGVYQGLTAEQREAIDSVGTEYPEAVIPLVTELEAEACTDIKEAGGEVEAIEHDAAYDSWKEEAIGGVRELMVRYAEDAGIDGASYEAFIDRYVELVGELEGEIGDRYTDGYVLCAQS